MIEAAKAASVRRGNLSIRLVAERLLDSTRELFDENPKTNMEKILSSIGFSQAEFAPGDDLDKIRGAILHDRKTILINSELSIQEKLFVLAHEIGHACLHPGTDKVDFATDSLNGLPDADRIAEIEANVFAYELLMPMAKFRKAMVDTDSNVKKLAEQFMVTKKRISKRIRYTNTQLSRPIRSR